MYLFYFFQEQKAKLRFMKDQISGTYKCCVKSNQLFSATFQSSVKTIFQLASRGFIKGRALNKLTCCEIDFVALL